MSALRDPVIRDILKRLEIVERLAKGNAEILQPNYLTVTPAGIVGANFSGVINAAGVILPIAPSSGVPADAVTWVDKLHQNDAAQGLRAFVEAYQQPPGLDSPVTAQLVAQDPPGHTVQVASELQAGSINTAAISNLECIVQPTGSPRSVVQMQLNNQFGPANIVNLLSLADSNRFSSDFWWNNHHLQTHAYLSGNQAIAAGTWTPIAWNANNGDPYGMQFNGVNGLKIPANSPGYYLVAWSVGFTLAANASWQASFVTKNADVPGAGDTVNQAYGCKTSTTTTDPDGGKSTGCSIVNCNGGDTIKLNAYSNAATNVAGFPYTTYMTVIPISPAVG